MRKIILFLWVIFLLLAYFYLQQRPDGNLHIVLCDVGQGDAILVMHNSTQVLIDGGRGSAVLECLKEYVPFWDRELEVMVATHPDADHIGGLEPVLNTYKVDLIISSDKTKETQVYHELVAAIERTNTPIQYPTTGDTIRAAGLEFEVLWPGKDGAETKELENGENNDDSAKNNQGTSKKTDDANAGSVTLRLEFGAFSALFTGDLEIEQEQTLISSGILEETTLLKVGHHGSNGSTSRAFLETLRPKIALISVGANNSYGHPARRVVNLLGEFQVETHRSDLEGSVEIISDGNQFWKKEPAWLKITL